MTYKISQSPFDELGLGGYLAVAYSDFFQSMVMLVGVLWILGAALREVGGLSAANRMIADLEPSLLSIWGRNLGYQGQFGIALGAVLIFSVGYMGWPHVVTPHMAMRRPATARLAGAYATGWNLLFVPAPYLLGILAIVVVPELTDPEMAIFQVAQKLLPAAATGVIMAAIMSTADSLLLQTGSIAARDLYQRFMNPHASERQMVWASRLLVLASGSSATSSPSSNLRRSSGSWSSSPPCWGAHSCPPMSAQCGGGEPTLLERWLRWCQARE